MKSNYLKIFRDKKEQQPLLKKILIESFSKIKLTKKQKIWWSICAFCMVAAIGMKVRAQLIGAGVIYHGAKTAGNILKVADLLKTKGNVTPELAQEIAESWSGIDIIKSMLKFITDTQIKSIEKINELPFGTSTMFDHIYYGLTIFAVIGCLYKLLMHFLKTERFDNVMAFTGFFQFIGIALLFVFSDQIVDHVVSLNQGVNTRKIEEMNLKLDKELSNSILNDLSYAVELLNDNKRNLDIERQKKSQATIITADNDIKIMSLQLERMKILTWDANLALQFKYIYFSFFISVIASIMAIPSIILSIMIKVLLTVMVAGTKIVFLMAFIPGFENTWKTFMSNMVNILLWAPIFNAIYGFIVAIIIFMMSDQSLGTGQIVWITIIACILAFQSISLTTSAAGVVIQGAGASMAGALGSMSTMSGVNVAMGATKAAVGLAVMKKFMSKGK
jgi:membrane protein